PVRRPCAEGDRDHATRRRQRAADRRGGPRRACPLSADALSGEAGFPGVGAERARGTSTPERRPRTRRSSLEIPMSRTFNPYIVLALAIHFPGAVHVAAGQAPRGFCFLIFTILFMGLSYQTTTPEHSFIGRHAGGLFIGA